MAEHAAAEAINRIQLLLTHPDDLNHKLPTLISKISCEKAEIDNQLLGEVRNAIEDIKNGLTQIGKSKSDISDIAKALHLMEKASKESQDNIENFEFIKSVYDRFYALESEIERVSMLIADDLKHNYKNSEHLLLIHYHLTKLEEFRSMTMQQVNKSTIDIRLIVEKFFQKLDKTWDMFEDFLWKLVENMVEIILASQGGLLIKVLKIIEYEEREDLKEFEYLDFKAKADSATLQQMKALGERPPRKVKSYKSRMMSALHTGIANRFKDKIIMEQKQSVSDSFKKLEFVIDELLVIHDELILRIPDKDPSFDFFILEYHRNVHYYLNEILKTNIGPSDILNVISWVTNYYDDMNTRVAIPIELLEPKLLDGNEDSLINEYISLTKNKIEEWISNLFDNESRAFINREGPPECDAKGIFISPGITVDLFHIFRQHIESTLRSSRSKLLSDVIKECVQSLLEFLKNMQNMLKKEVQNAIDKPDDIAIGIEYYLIMMANSCMICCDNLEEILKKVEKEINDEYKVSSSQELKKVIDGFSKLSKECYRMLIDIIFATLKPVINQLFTPKWYEGQFVETILVTFEDYYSDFQNHTLEFIFGKIIVESSEKFILCYFEQMRARNSKFKISECSDILSEDYSNAIRTFSQYRPMKRIQKIFEPLEKVIALLTADKKLIYPDFPLIFLEDILVRRDDMDKSTLRETMESCRKKVKEEKVQITSPSIFSSLTQ
ncbi:Exocyst complex component Sec6 domain-containing protein [Rozella allomycis CSF55]|uniref:Exocyst complex component Sec6 domain-containing protein n=1 Tax=Rozella allomycis (strain CSF55) TaxID=988480 RepID=A0A075APN1_ROZAC|nr:Exocyst complex component Sec6 domain-containing protein [Rozella allomycis CSF55]|eukprot:EPZ32109.1 Exocyst complex component Sec6 domain-containing protein [Rozella allomycis CSF55]